MPERAARQALAVGIVVAKLAERFGLRLSTNPVIRLAHGSDESYHKSAAPDAVVFPETNEEVAAIVALCAEHRVPVIAFGVGTSLEGHVAALEGGICVDLSRMNKILEVRSADMDATVQAGVTRKQLNEHLRDTGLFFSVDPGADATLGGMAATGASGTTTVRYGTMRENVLSLTVVMPSGQIVRTRSRARKSSAGYDLTRLFIGSEGTLGIITEVTVRLFGIPEAELTALCPFQDFAGAVETVILAIQLGIPLARIEFLDAAAAKGLAQYAKLDLPSGAERPSNGLAALPPAPTLFVDFHGSPAGVEEACATFRSVAEEHGLLAFETAKSTEERKRIWDARHGALFAALALAPGCRPVITDVCVPISALAECIAQTRDDIDASGLQAPIVGHVGDGNFHCTFMIDRDSAAEIIIAKGLNQRLVARALAMGGTSTGEHGVGSGKIDFLELEHPTALPVMRAIKQALDPLGIMNPGKILRV
jgi:D-lactate dehydrogenase (cytochrome)